MIAEARGLFWGSRGSVAENRSPEKPGPGGVPRRGRGRGPGNGRAQILTAISAPDLDLAEARRAGPVTRAHHLLRLSFAAVGHAPKRPVLPPGNRLAGIPELGRDAAVARVLQHADALAVPDLPRDLAAELKVIALVVDGPAF